MYNQVIDDAKNLYNAFAMVQILQFMNMTFLLQDVVTLIITRIMGRFFIYPTLQQFTDLCLFVSSILIIEWYTVDI